MEYSAKSELYQGNPTSSELPALFPPLHPAPNTLVTNHQ